MNILKRIQLKRENRLKKKIISEAISKLNDMEFIERPKTGNDPHLSFDVISQWYKGGVLCCKVSIGLDDERDFFSNQDNMLSNNILEMESNALDELILSVFKVGVWDSAVSYLDKQKTNEQRR